MIPILYDKYETAFTHNGLGRLADCISCTVTEERNGIYECQFTYPVTGAMFSEIQEGRIIAVIHEDTKDIQPFDIYAHSAPLNGVVTFYAHHISYRLGSVILKPVEASSCAAAFATIPNNTYNRCPFSFWTDKATSGRWENKVPSAVKAILGGQEGSILDVFGKGDYKWDKFTVRLYADRGNDNGISIRYGVNLTDLKQEYDESGSYNAVAPYWVNREDGTVVTLTKGIVAVSSGTHLVPWTTKSGEEITDRAGNTIYFEVDVPVTPVPMDLSDAFEEQPTEAQLEAEALRRLNSSEAWLPSENITVKFVNLADTEEYRNVAALQRVSLCDKVSVYCGPLNVSAVKMQVIRVVYNVLTERYNEMELGKAKTSFSQSIAAQVEEITKDMPTTSMMQQAINNATIKITGALGGPVRFMYDANGEMKEILIMDTDDINTAVNVWRWNSGGFGFSSNGYSGQYALAMTMDGAIVADFITAGHALFNILKGGTLTLGGFDNVDGSMIVMDENGTTIGTWNKDGLTLNKGNIAGPSITLGGDRNYNGELSIQDFMGHTTGSWNNEGIKIGYQTVKIHADSDVFNIADIDSLHIEGEGDVILWDHEYGSMREKRKRKISVDSETFSRYTSNGALEHEWSMDYTYHGISAHMDDYIIYNLNNNQMCRLVNSASNPIFYLNAEQQVYGDFSVGSGYTKSKVITTDQYADRLLYCYETPSPLFGDVGEAVIGEDGLCYVTIDPIFAQTITTDSYQVFLQRYGEGDCYVKERKAGWFVVAGTTGLAFGWEIKGRQADIADVGLRRLDRNDEKFTVPTQTYGEDAATHIDDIRKEREAA